MCSSRARISTENPIALSEQSRSIMGRTFIYLLESFIFETFKLKSPEFGICRPVGKTQRFFNIMPDLYQPHT